jgi:hypothetical protein
MKRIHGTADEQEESGNKTFESSSMCFFNILTLLDLAEI